MSVTSWTSEGMDWSSVDKIRLGSLYSHFEAVRLAILERFKVVYGSSAPGPSEFWRDAYELRPRPILSVCQTMHSAMDTFVATSLQNTPINHNDSGGDWSGVDFINKIAPQYDTWESLLVAIGDSSRIACPRNLETDVAPWLLQQYKILNQIRWFRLGGSPPGTGFLHSASSRVEGGSASLPELIAAESWASTGISSFWQEFRCRTYKDSSGASMSRSWIEFAFSGLPLTGTCDVYAIPGADGVFGNAGGLLENAASKMQADIDAAEKMVFDTGNPDTMIDGAVVGFLVNAMTVVFKPAFAFRDW